MRPKPLIENRAAAGRELAGRLSRYKGQDCVVLALPRGGVPVAVEIARALDAPLDLVLVRKIGLPRQPELAAAAVVDGGAPEIVVNDEVVANAGLDDAYLAGQARHELAEIERRRSVYLAGRPRVRLDGRTLIVVDDGIATGATVRAALAAMKRKSPKRLILAVPVAAPEAIAALRPLVDEIVCLEVPARFYAIGMHYRDFHQLEDAEVLDLLRSLDRTRKGGP